MSDARPTHLNAQISDTYPWFADTTLCGIKTAKPEALPYVGAHAAQAHIDGYGMQVCDDCFAIWQPDATQPPAPGQLELP